MTKNKIALTLFTVSVLITGAFLIKTNLTQLTSVFAQSKKSDDKSQQERVLTAEDVIDEANEDISDDERARINDKKLRYNIQFVDGSAITGRPRRNNDLTQLSDGVGVGSISEAPELSLLPTDKSALILVAKVEKAQPYLSENKTALFTEFTLKVEQVLKNKNSLNLAPESTIFADRDAGAMRLKSGKVIRYERGNKGQVPRLGKRYLLFIDPINQGKDLSIISGYELRNGKIESLRRSKEFIPGTKQTRIKKPFGNLNESQFIQVVRDAINDPSKAHELERGLD